MTDQHLSLDTRFMLRALELAGRGKGHVSPNPLVGAVVVHGGKIIGEGWHRKFGSSHAEVNAIRRVHEPSLLKESTLYVTLEPCTHFGKTPPCTDLIIGHGIRRVVIANHDPNPNVSGNGVVRLRDAGVEVITGVMEDEGKVVNKTFLTAMKEQRPYIILKWAQTADGFMAKSNHDSKWISNPYSRMLVHKWRTEEDAVLVGTNTAFYDNPRLNVRDWNGRNPIRIVIDRNLRLARGLNLFDGTQETLCYNQEKDESGGAVKLVKLDEERFVEGLLRDLYSRNIHSLIVEGGAQTIKLFLDRKAWDEARIFVAQSTFKQGIQAPVPEGNLTSSLSVSNDVLTVYKPL